MPAALPTVTRARITRASGLVTLGLLAALYFHRSIGATLDWTDEGMIVYPSWRVSVGELPYVDFQHVYGPSLFFLNGALFWLFGSDLHVIRLFLVAVKALVAVLVYMLGRRLAPRPVALLTWAILVAVWGTPIWLFNTPYAAYYTTALCLLGLRAFLGGSPGRPPNALLAGLCFGVAATFKQTQGLFAFLSLVLFVVFATRAQPDRGPAPRSPDGFARRVAGLVRLLALLAALGLSLVYVQGHLATVTVALLLAPFALGILALARWEVVGWPPPDRAVRSLRTLVQASLGMALPLAAYAAFYWWQGALAALRYDTLSGLPQRIAWFVPLRAPPAETVLFDATLLASAAVVGAWGRGGTPRGRWGTIALVGALVGLGLALSGLLSVAARTMGLGPYLLQGRWLQEFPAALPELPFCLLATAAVSLLRRDSRTRSEGAPLVVAGRDTLGLLFFFAAGALLQLYPAADLPHVMMLLPAFVPLLAHALGTFLHGPEGAPSRAGARLLVLGWPLAAIVLFVQNWVALEPAPVEPARGFVRASGVSGVIPPFGDAADLVRHLSGAATSDGSLLVIANQQMLYFLAGMRATLERQEFVLYLVGAGIVSDDDARTLADEDAMIRTLEASRPLVVDDVTSPAGARVRSAFPRLARFLAETYGPPTAIGRYRVQAPRD